MIKVLKNSIGITGGGGRHPVIPEDDVALDVAPENFYVIHKYNGMDELHVELYDDATSAASSGSSIYQVVGETNILSVETSTVNDEFYVTNVDIHGRWVTVDAVINLQDLRGEFRHLTYQKDVTLQQALENVLPAEWVVRGYEKFTEKHDIEAMPGEPIRDKNILELVLFILDIWQAKPQWSSKGKTLFVVDPNASSAPKSELIQNFDTDLTSYNGNSTNLITRIYPYGAKNEKTGEYLSIESVNGGKNYIDGPFQYASGVIAAGFTDESIKDPAELFNAAQKKLIELNQIKRSYDVNIVDKNIDLFDLTMLQDRGSVVIHQCVEKKEYPERPDLNEFTMGTVSPSIEYTLKRVSPTIDITDQSLAATTGINIRGQETSYVDNAHHWTPSARPGSDNYQQATGGGTWDGKIGGVNNQYGTLLTFNRLGDKWGEINNTGVNFKTENVREQEATGEYIGVDLAEYLAPAAPHYNKRETKIDITPSGIKKEFHRGAKTATDFFPQEAGPEYDHSYPLYTTYADDWGIYITKNLIDKRTGNLLRKFKAGITANGKVMAVLPTDGNSSDFICELYAKIKDYPTDPTKWTIGFKMAKPISLPPGTVGPNI